MNSRGRGRGRGQRPQNPVVSSPWSQRSNIEKPSLHQDEKPNNHELLRAKMVSMAAKYSMEDDSSEEELNDEEILNKTIQQYQDVIKGDSDFGSSADHPFLLEVLQSGALTCLVCIDNVKRLDATWSCISCRCIFHLQCIQKWAREGIGRLALQIDEEIEQENLVWNCPKCRHEYSPSECPTKYFCFCGKVESPEFDPWTVPHSCGQQCEKGLVPKCGHNCLLLCHPGPCPPCPKTIKSKCYCGKKGPSLKRCSKKQWSCNDVCAKPLSCGKHDCQQFCHEGECPPCPNKSQQYCMCKKNKDERDCADPIWSCEKVCGIDLSCGFHSCDKTCHLGECGDCPRAGSRTCPCGKTTSTLPCFEDIGNCEDTCLKEMSCGKHQCSKRCHYGPCETCMQVVEKTCCCGKRKKELPCKQQYTCDIKCTKTRACGRHPCKRKCCDGNCPPCEQICNRTLNCRNHKCPSPCHTGMCYPCPAMTKVSCFCKKTYVTVPCGKEKTLKPPRCKQMCKNKSHCHHEQQKPHRCHFKRCPPCKITCDLKYGGCDHTCQQNCHDQIFDKEAFEMSKLRSNNKVIEDNYYSALQCPPCQYPVEKLCMGKHVIEKFPCSEVKVYSCKRECGREVACENHTCVRECHVVKGNPEEGKAGRNCIPCEEICLKERPDGCIHDCKQPCHPGDCVPCGFHLKIDCHCGSIKKYIKCSEYTDASAAEKDELLFCGSRCTKILACAHLCPLSCHKGGCASVSDCIESTKVKCSCGRRKKDIPCVEYRANNITSLDCDDKCREIRNKKKKEEHMKEELEKAAALKKQQEELEWFERKKQGRKRKNKHSASETSNETSLMSRNKLIIGIGITVVVVAVLVLQWSLLQ